MIQTAGQTARAQRRPRADGERTRGAILHTAVSLATVDGLEGPSIGNLAACILRLARAGVPLGGEPVCRCR